MRTSLLVDRDIVTGVEAQIADSMRKIDSNANTKEQSAAKSLIEEYELARKFAQQIMMWQQAARILLKMKLGSDAPIQLEGVPSLFNFWRALYRNPQFFGQVLHSGHDAILIAPQHLSPASFYAIFQNLGTGLDVDFLVDDTISYITEKNQVRIALTSIVGEHQPIEVCPPWRISLRKNNLGWSEAIGKTIPCDDKITFEQLAKSAPEHHRFMSLEEVFTYFITLFYHGVTLSEMQREIAALGSRNIGNKVADSLKRFPVVRIDSGDDEQGVLPALYIEGAAAENIVPAREIAPTVVNIHC